MFVCAVSIRGSERSHSYHQVLHDFAEQIERLLTVLLLLLFGGAVVGGRLASLTWRAAAAGLALVFVVRPLSVCVHGVSATPVMKRLDRRHGRSVSPAGS